MTRRRGDESAGNDAICSYKVDAIGVESVREMEPFGAAIIPRAARAPQTGSERVQPTKVS